MDDIRKQDARLFFRETVTFGRLAVYAVWLFLVYSRFFAHASSVGPLVLMATAGVILAVGTAYTASVKKRFKSKEIESRWTGCQDRMNRFEDVLRKTKKSKVADLREMPNTIREVSHSIYLALRRADIITEEIAATEAGMLAQPPTWQASTQDAQSRELYRIADKNIAEYRTQFAGVMAGVQRSVAQSAVFMTTLDNLRMKMIGYRLVGRNPDMGTEDFLSAIAEAKLQLQSIDTALEELDLGHYPKTISVVPPLPAEEVVRIRESQ